MQSSVNANSTKKNASKKGGVANKTAADHKAKTPKNKKRLLPKALRLEQMDRLLLKLAPMPYEKVRKQVQLGKKRLDAERELALKLGARILEKAKSVRGQLISSYRKKKK